MPPMSRPSRPRRIASRLFAVAACVSQVVMLAVCVLWAWSHRTAHFLGYGRDQDWVGALSMSGLVRVEYGGYAGGFSGWSCTSYSTPAGGLGGEVRARDRGGGRLRDLGFATARIDYAASGRPRRAAYVPHWFLALVLGALPAAWATGAVRRRRARPGLCRSCGYDLRASPDRCPECGTPVTPAATGRGTTA